MIETISAARQALEADSLLVSHSTPTALLIGASSVDTGDGVHVFKDACALIGHNGGWTAVLPADGMLTYEVPGTLSDLVALICDIYRDFRASGGKLCASVQRVIENPEQYLIGRSLASV